jgi:hypothetical protein
MHDYRLLLLCVSGRVWLSCTNTTRRHGHRHLSAACSIPVSPHPTKASEFLEAPIQGPRSKCWQWLRSTRNSESDQMEGKDHSLAVTVPTLPFSQFRSRPNRRLEACGGVLCSGRWIQSNKTIRQLIHPCVQQLVLARKREMQLPGRAPCLDMSPLLTPTDKLEPCPAADGDGHRAEPLGAHAWIMDDGCMHAYLTDWHQWMMDAMLMIYCWCRRTNKSKQAHVVEYSTCLLPTVPAPIDTKYAAQVK